MQKFVLITSLLAPLVFVTNAHGAPSVLYTSECKAEIQKLIDLTKSKTDLAKIQAFQDSFVIYEEINLECSEAQTEEEYETACTRAESWYLAQQQGFNEFSSFAAPAMIESIAKACTL